jgi:hypothetical protein
MLYFKYRENHTGTAAHHTPPHLYLPIRVVNLYSERKHVSRGPIGGTRSADRHARNFGKPH